MVAPRFPDCQLTMHAYKLLWKSENPQCNFMHKINNNYVIITISCVISHLFSSSSEQHSCFKLRCRKGNEIYNSNIVQWQPQIKGTETVLWYWRRSYRNRCTLFNLGESITSCLKYEPVCYVLQTTNDVY